MKLAHNMTIGDISASRLLSSTLQFIKHNVDLSHYDTDSREHLYELASFQEVLKDWSTIEKDVRMQLQEIYQAGTQAEVSHIRICYYKL